MSHNDTPQLSQDTAFDLLSSSRRRFIVRRLKTGSGGIDLQTLAAELAAKEAKIDQEELNAQQRKRTYVSLYQTHIPKLAEAGVVRYDAEDGVVREGPALNAVASYFETTGEDRQWEPLYIGISLGGLAGILITVGLGNLVVATIIGAIAMITVGALSVVEYRQEQ